MVNTQSRREFLKTSIFGLLTFPALSFSWNLIEKEKRASSTKVALVYTDDRKYGVKKSISLLGINPVKGKRIMIKPNFNTADPTPASTHNDTLTQLVIELRRMGAREIILGERSGPPDTRKVMEEKGIFNLAKELDFNVINFEELKENEWVHFNPPGNHWKEGFYIPKIATEVDEIVSTCCLKTHQYGGVFTMSLKLSVGMTPKKLMRELHTSPHMRKMIAEINSAYEPCLIVLDGVEAFVDGGPSFGKKKQTNVFLAGTDRIAVDAVGLAVLKEVGSNEAIMGKKIFEQEQIARAVELGLGIDSPDKIEIVAEDERSKKYAEKIYQILKQG
ncbi:DUF362 domain-containing protein [Candidatus Aminicenantes bacterium AC-335-A11]|jgi:uncharacterized protein (DUF362 family)|nr:DUF362 domain-containing protein [SCandidatus Aminicenantes bacterium Aminicenantia_JdfR_composite]MCP2598024.1 DUF362 domain-containing protein [Candidatus Aminicenantes bacterium AC-335-L06]MCP2619066.1 DUF362 domain-containing protein [Candidatus Aminicenantes bacterium AC-335-A11]